MQYHNTNCALLIYHLINTLHNVAFKLSSAEKNGILIVSQKMLPTQHFACGKPFMQRVFKPLASAHKEVFCS